VSFLRFFLTKQGTILICLLLGSSMRTVEKRLIEFNLQALYAQLRRDPTPGIFCNNVNKMYALILVERAALQNAIARATGSNVSDLRL
jgi:hypothetical protein